MSNGLDPDLSHKPSVGLDLGPNCLQRFQQTTKVTASKDRVKMKKVNKQCLLDTPQPVRVSEKNLSFGK